MRDAAGWVVLAVGVVVAVARPFIPPHGPSWPGTYQALAHVYVGGLFGAWLADRQGCRWCLYLALALTVVEVVAAVLGRLLSGGAT
jgi:hypothetical protein